ncbi:MAG: hypothetical protein NDJ72_13575, partial [Elusimicrobia bacterium]|nr:hypothetical protein [Elusimicrobiota bacterium]
RAEDAARLEPWARFWSRWVSSAFLTAYLEKMGDSKVLPKSREELNLLLEAMMINRALGEIQSELESQPQWAVIPLKGLDRLLGPA